MGKMRSYPQNGDNMWITYTQNQQSQVADNAKKLSQKVLKAHQLLERSLLHNDNRYNKTCQKAAVIGQNKPKQLPFLLGQMKPGDKWNDGLPNPNDNKGKYYFIRNKCYALLCSRTMLAR